MTFLTCAEVAEALQETPATTSRRCKRGEIPAKKVGKSWRIHRADFEAFMAPDNQQSTSAELVPFVTAAQKRQARSRAS